MGFCAGLVFLGLVYFWVWFRRGRVIERFAAAGTHSHRGT